LTTRIAITGKSGSGKTTIVKAFMRLFREMFPEKSILLFDNDLSSELGHSFGLDIRNTIYGIRSGKHEYKTGIPEDMSKQEFI
jgi:CO dehydrogenase nickel-insertion accessory protein CooC1